MQKIHITLEKDQRLWFTSDLHFGHRNVIKFCNRPYSDEKEMGPKLIENWNNVVSDNDIVFVLGDTFWFNDSRSIKKILGQFKGKQIYILPGNHDDFNSYYRVNDPRIILCQDIVALWVKSDGWEKEYEVWLSHYPLTTWPHRDNGALQLFGHIHSQSGKTTGFDQDLKLHPKQFDVGCDYWNWTPVSFEAIRNLI